VLNIELRVIGQRGPYTKYILSAIIARWGLSIVIPHNWLATNISNYIASQGKLIQWFPFFKYTEIRKVIWSWLELSYTVACRS
jgi:hypothetical protein